MGPTHRLFGALAGASVASATGQPWSMVAMSALAASATSHGWSSPDVDLTRPWRFLSFGPLRGLMGHREVAHWFGWPALAWWLGLPALPAEPRWLAMMLLVGWSSHLAGDALFGKVPLLPWGGPRVGLGLSTGGFLEMGRVRFFGRKRRVLPFPPARLLLGSALVWVLAGAPGGVLLAG